MRSGLTDRFSHLGSCHTTDAARDKDVDSVKALTIRQPWAYAILRLGKDVENRSWRTHYRGPLLIHAAARPEGNPRKILAEYMKRPRNKAFAIFQSGASSESFI
jgi:hypothetical protein